MLHRTVQAHRGTAAGIQPGGLWSGQACTLAANRVQNIRLGGPVWAAIVALADQYAGRPLGFVNHAIYQIGRSAWYHRAFHDVTMGNNTVQVGSVTVTGFGAGPGWDPVTGWGSPDAQVLIPLLARYVTG
jgi:hypothetical protein